MIDFTALHEQNHRITEAAQVLMYLAQERAVCDADTTRQVFQDAIGMIDKHLTGVDRLIKRLLLAHPDPRDQNLGRKLSAESALLRSNFDKYAQRWTCGKRKEFQIRDHQRFVEDTQELFSLMLERIERETELIFPLLKRVSDPGEEAA